jgi:hypothetical protein
LPTTRRLLTDMLKAESPGSPCPKVHERNAASNWSLPARSFKASGSAAAYI